MNNLSNNIINKNNDISIIIPSKDFLESLVETVNSLLNQITIPKEIIIVDSSNAVSYTHLTLPTILLV